MEILPGLHRIETLLGNRKLYQHLYVGDRVILIDTGTSDTMEEHIFPYLEKLGRVPADIDMAIISHADADHFGGNSALKRAAPHAWIACHAFDFEWISDPEAIMEGRYNQFADMHDMSYPEEVRSFLRGMMGSAVVIDLTLTGGETIILANGRPLQLLALPGHTRGHVGIYDPVEKAAVLTDAVLWKGLPDVDGHVVMPPTYCHTETYRTTIQAVAQLPIETLCLSHYDLLEGRTAIEDFLSETQRFVDRMDSALLEAIAESGESGLTLRELIDRVDPIVGPFGDASAELAYPVLGHMKEFTSQGLVRAGKIGNLIRWCKGENSEARIRT